LIFTCFACGKGGTVKEEPHVIIDKDDTYPVVEINTPTENAVFISGNTINVTGKVSDNSLYQGRIVVRKDSDGSVVKEQYYEIHYIPIYNFSMSFSVSVIAATDYTISVKFEDHGHNLTAKTVKIIVNP
jgi:hypothetical protein